MIAREYRLKTRGQMFAFAIATVVLLFATVLAWLGDTDMAGKVAIGTLVGLVSVFVGGRLVDAYGEGRRTHEDE